MIILILIIITTTIIIMIIITVIITIIIIIISFSLHHRFLVNKSCVCLIKGDLIDLTWYWAKIFTWFWRVVCVCVRVRCSRVLWWQVRRTLRRPERRHLLHCLQRFRKGVLAAMRLRNRVEGRLQERSSPVVVQPMRLKFTHLWICIKTMFIIIIVTLHGDLPCSRGAETHLWICTIASDVLS